MRKLGSSLIFCLFSVAGLHAQQQPQYTMYMANNYVLNPAVAGIEDYTDVRLSYRAQWVGVEDAPRTMYATINGPVASFGRRRHGLGGIMLHDQTGPTTRFSGLVSYAFHLPVSDKITTSFGVSAGIESYTLDVSRLELRNPNDAVLTKGNYTQLLPAVHAGIWVYTPDIFLGIASQNLIESKLTYHSEAETDIESNKLYRHFFITGGFRFRLGDELTATPAVMLKIVRPVPVSFDINFKMQFKDRLWAGVSYRKRDGFAALGGVYISPLINVSYAYDYVTSDLRNYTSGSHEIILGILLNNFGKELCPKNVW